MELYTVSGQQFRIKEGISVSRNLYFHVQCSQSYLNLLMGMPICQYTGISQKEETILNAPSGKEKTKQQYAMEMRNLKDDKTEVIEIAGFNGSSFSCTVGPQKSKDFALIHIKIQIIVSRIQGNLDDVGCEVMYALIKLCLKRCGLGLDNRHVKLPSDGTDQNGKRLDAPYHHPDV
jgi:hypothetical protein